MYQKLMTKEVIKKLPKLYSTDGKADNERPIVVKFFTPWSNWTWWALEGEPLSALDAPALPDGSPDWLFYGLVEGFEKELGNFTLSQLLEIKGPFGLKVERDMHFDGHTLADVR